MAPVLVLVDTHRGSVLWVMDVRVGNTAVSLQAQELLGLVLLLSGE